MKIIKFEKHGDKYKIYLDDKQVIETYEDVILRNNLLYKKEISEVDINRINFKTIYSNVYHKLQKLISTKYRSEKWVRDYLKKNTDFDDLVKEEIINKLKKANFINDERYAVAYTNDKINLSLDGPYKVVSDLAKENINMDDVVLKMYTSDIIQKRITKIISKKCLENKKYMGFMLEKRICDYLKSMGYSAGDINSYKYLIKSNDDIALKEFEKAYTKYSKKLKDEKLYLKLKEVLYRHGINSSEIDDLIVKKRLEESLKKL